jgi:hypothetical protein
LEASCGSVITPIGEAGVFQKKFAGLVGAMGLKRCVVLALHELILAAQPTCD